MAGREEVGCDTAIAEEDEHTIVAEKIRKGMPDEDLLVDIAELFKVFGDSTRTKILAALSQSECCVCCLSSVLGMSVSAVSHQLRILRQSKLVKTRRIGKEVYYSLDDEHIGEIFTTALEHVKEL
ncbi:MAG: helix-turn-helix transcriptional regulator [Clostridiales bacterium]|nr:helix-turn-helix transcriptional regulator [Clostridiales bacterium]